MPLPWRSRFVYGTGGDVTTWTTRLTTRPWDYTTSTVGGSRTAGSGTPAAYVVRRDYLLSVNLRLYEGELRDLEALLAWGQEAESILWYPDTTEADSYSVYLEHPQAGEEIRPIRLQEFPLVFEVELVLRRILDEPWPLEYFVCED